MRLANRMKINQDICYRSFGFGQDKISEKFLNYMLAGNLAIFELNFLIEKTKQEYCQLRPDMRWYVGNPDLGQSLSAFGYRKGLNENIKESINTM